MVLETHKAKINDDKRFPFIQFCQRIGLEEILVKVSKIIKREKHILNIILRLHILSSLPVKMLK